MKKKIGIIGFGNMGSVIAARAKSNYRIIVFDKDKSKTANLEDLELAPDLAELMVKSRAVILAVKPQDIQALLQEIKQYFSGQLIISIAAGIPTHYIENYLRRAHVIRVMPNMPAQIGAAISTVAKGSFSNDKDLDLVWKLLSCIGEVLILSSEEMINAATAISGSGPAYFCYFIKNKSNIEIKKREFIEQLTEAGMSINFDKNTAQRLSRATVEGTVALLKSSDLSCEDIIKRVASKGGTTEAALAVLDKSGSLERAVKAALRRAKELSKRSK